MSAGAPSPPHPGFAPMSEEEMDRLLHPPPPSPPPWLVEALAEALAEKLKPAIRDEVRAALRTQAPSKRERT